MYMELSKKGKFTLVAAAASNPGRCGSATNRDFAYEVKVEVPSNYLDKDDFVMDHLLIQKFFEDTFGKEPWILSCEMIAARTLLHFYNALAAQGVTAIDVNIIADNVNHRCYWRGTMGAPKMPAIKSSFANVGSTWQANAQLGS